MDTTHLKAWLPFDESATLDRCGGTWTAYGSPTISTTNAISGKALQLDGSGQYLDRNESCELGGTDFTIHYYQNKTGGASRATPFNIYYDESHFMLLSGEGWYINYTRTNSMPAGFCHIEFDYVHSEQKVYFFVNGTLINSRSTNIFVTRLPYTVRIGTASWGSEGSRDYFGGTIDEFMIHDGVALHSENFTPPTTTDYAAITSWAVTVNADVEALIANRDPSSGYWRYENPGSGDYMDSQPAVVTETVDYKQSITGVAFHNGNQSDMCNTPAGVREIWMRFDLYWESQGSSPYVICYVGNQATAGFYGVSFGGSAFENSGNRCYFTNSDTKAYLASPSRNRCLLHMISGITDGFMEFELNGAPYVCVRAGNVNNGEDFRNPFFYNFVRIWHPDWNGLFSNIVVSNAPLSLEDGWHRNQFPVEHNIKAVDLCVRKNGRTYEIPFSTTNSAPANSVVARVGHKTVYNPLVATTDENASGLKVRCNGEDRALSASFN